MTFAILLTVRLFSTLSFFPAMFFNIFKIILQKPIFLDLFLHYLPLLHLLSAIIKVELTQTFFET